MITRNGVMIATETASISRVLLGVLIIFVDFFVFCFVFVLCELCDLSFKKKKKEKKKSIRTKHYNVLCWILS